jgi:hypothetical protein
MTLRTRRTPTETEHLPLARTLCCFALGCLLTLPSCKEPEATPNDSGLDAGDEGNENGDGDDDDATSGDGDGDDPCDSFLGCGDAGDDAPPPAVEPCDFWSQDCDEGEKCTPVPSSPGSGAWDATVCVTAGTEAPGSACSFTGAVNGEDTCDATSMCLDVDADTGEGTCTELCVGSPESNSCPQTGNACWLLNDGQLPVCLDGCNPLITGECPPGQTCVAGFEGGDLNGFLCFAPAAQGITGEQCECANCCADGHFCTDAPTYGNDCAFDLCCTEYCDVSDGGFACAGTGQQCIALFDASDPNYADVGACQIPM